MRALSACETSTARFGLTAMPQTNKGTTTPSTISKSGPYFLRNNIPLGKKVPIKGRVDFSEIFSQILGTLVADTHLRSQPSSACQ